MKRACYRRSSNGYEICHLKAVRKDGNIEIEPIEEFKNIKYESLTDVILSANMCGYGIVGDYDEIKNRNEEKFYKEKCGSNMMDIDEL